MGFLAAAAGLVGGLFNHANSGLTNYPNSALLAENAAMVNETNAQTLEESIKSARSQEQIVTMMGQSNRAQVRASALATITTRHEGLMQSIQQAESSHIKSSFDIVKQA